MNDKGLEELETQLAGLRMAVRRALAAGDRSGVKKLRRELRQAERAWEQTPSVEVEVEVTKNASSLDNPSQATDPASGRRQPGLPPVREQVHQALTLLRVPAAGKLAVAVHEAFFAGSLTSRRLSSLRRDEERSFRSSPHSRPYYLCAALTADLLAPARGLFAVSTWPMDQRVIGPLSPRVDHLTATIRIAEQIHRLEQTGEQPPLSSRRLISRLAQSIPGAIEASATTVDPDTVIRTATAELGVHAESDRAYRERAARWAIELLDAGEQLFGGKPRTWKVKKT